MDAKDLERIQKAQRQLALYARLAHARQYVDQGTDRVEALALIDEVLEMIEKGD